MMRPCLQEACDPREQMRADGTVWLCMAQREGILLGGGSMKASQGKCIRAHPRGNIAREGIPAEARAREEEFVVVSAGSGW